MRIEHLIDGRPAGSARYFETVNPATQEVLAEVARGGAAEVDAAVAAAKAAFPKWAATPAADRARVMRRLGELIAANVGPIARTVEDCALIFAAIHGADPADPSAVDAPFDWRPAAPIRGRRLGFVEAQFAAEGEWRDAHRGALDTLRGLGAELVPVEMPKVPGRVVSTILSAEAAAAFSDLTLSGEIDDILAPRPSNWAKSMREARFIPAVEYIQANRVRTGLIRQTEDLFSRHRVEAWVTPAQGDHLSLTNATGHPAVCVPAGFAPVKDQPADSPRRNATAITFHAPLFADDRALEFAHAFQRATRWHEGRPPVS